MKLILLATHCGHLQRPYGVTGTQIHLKPGLIAVVNEGGDADTNGAIACAILGAKYGYNATPRYYIENLHNEIEYRQKVNGFIALAINEKRIN